MEKVSNTRRYALIADLRQENADMGAKVLREAGFGVTTATIDVSSRASVHALVDKATLHWNLQK